MKRDICDVSFNELNEAIASAKSVERSCVSLKYLNDEPPKLPRFVVGGLIPEESCLVLGAVEKTGKTWYAFDLAVCVASGQPFLGETDEPDKARTVLIYSPEGGWHSKKRRLWGLCWGRRLDPRETLQRVPFIDGNLDLTNERQVLQLRDVIKDLKPALTIIDPLITSLTGVDENDSVQVQAVLNTTRALIECSPGMSIIVAHHLNKGHKDKVNFHALRGSSAISAWCDGLIRINKLGNDFDCDRRVDVELRDGPPPRPVIWRLDTWEGEVQGLKAYRLKEVKEAKKKEEFDSKLMGNIMELTKKSSGIYGVEMMSQHFKVSREKLQKHLDHLIRGEFLKLDLSKKIVKL